MGQVVFISYSRRDSGYVGELVRFLQAHQIPAWADSAINYGDHWEEVIVRQIDDCAAFVPVMTPDAWSSPWVRNEIARARLKNKPILPLLLAGEHFFGLSHLEAEDVRSGQMPTPAFVARLQSMLGPGTVYGVRYPAPPGAEPDASAARRRSRWLWPAVAAAAVLLIVGGIVGFNVLNRSAAATAGHTPPSNGTASPGHTFRTGDGSAVVEHLRSPQTIGPLNLSYISPTGSPNGGSATFTYQISDITGNTFLQYSDPSHSAEQFVVIAATGKVTDYAHVPDKYLPTVDASTLEQVDAGQLTGVAKCGELSGGHGAYISCAWADPGSIGLVYCNNVPKADCVALFPAIRNAVLVRD